MRLYCHTLLVLAMSAALLSGCSDGTDGAATTGGTGNEEGSWSPSVSENTGFELPSEADVEAYFQAASMYDVVALDRAVMLAEEGSVAEAYAIHVLGYANASIDGGVPLAGSPAVRADDGYESCDMEGCVTWGNIRGRGGKLVDFTVNGVSLEGRMTVGTGTRVAAGELAYVTLLSAYRSVTTGALAVVAEVRSGDEPIKLGHYEATYRSPEGRESVAVDFMGPPALAPNETATVLMSFPNADIGGTVTVPVFSSDFMVQRAALLPTL